MSRLCYISRNYNDRTGAGVKAKSDVEDIIHQMGGVNLGLKRSFYKNKFLTFILNLLGIVKFVLLVKKGDVVVLQYPVKKYFIFICKVCRLRGARSISLIHDLGSFRRKKLTVERELERLSYSDHLITLNPSMREWLIENGCTREISVQGVWDYLSDAETSKILDERDPERRMAIVYAGSLAAKKNPFLYDLVERVDGFDLHLFGDYVKYKRELSGKNLYCHGFVEAEQMISKPTGDFALVWDGDSIESCRGSFGAYLQYNTPHKISLYIRMGLPIIIWRRAAMAQFILDNGIGVCIDSLSRLNDALRGITPEQYDLMRRNILEISSRVATGDYFRSTILDVLRRVS